jgi:hypothetical protein
MGDTVQIGGNNVYGVGGPVMSAENSSQQVERSLMSGGVLVEPAAELSTATTTPRPFGCSPRMLAASTECRGSHSLMPAALILWASLFSKRKTSP